MSVAAASMEKAREFNSKGITIFKEKAYEQALKDFCKIPLYLKHLCVDENYQNYQNPSDQLTPEQMSPVVELLFKGYRNSAACLYHLKRWNESLEAIQNALKLKPSDAGSALLRRGLVLLELKDFDEAAKDLQRVLDQHPKDGDARRGMKQVKRRIAESDQAQRRQFAGIFDKYADAPNLVASYAKSS